MKIIKTRIKIIRKQLDDLIEKTNNCRDKKVIELSRKLDRIIHSYIVMENSKQR
ncbi:MAG: Spo0E family sporulation regulatory protein-aspartic acid phosphatase [Clostridiaceae bacterium]|nr:Spo0E family sporulation regulatory protein-aspartic acid phosphatase [Clostridiaceae bacterium]